MAYEDYITAGLAGAQNLLNTSSYSGYPQFVPSQQTAPTKTDYYTYTPTTPLQQIQAPNYQGLMGGDYDKLQQSLYQPAATSAGTAYNQGLMNLGDVMSNRGMYGSSIMGNDLNNNLNKTYMDTLSNAAANAAAQRYQLQSSDLQNQNSFNADMFKNAQSQALNTWKANLTENQAKQSYDLSKLTYDSSYDEALRNWQNAKDYEKYQYQLASETDHQAYNEKLLNSWLALAGHGSTGTNSQTAARNAANQYQAAIQASRNALSAANTTGLLSLAATVGGSALRGGLLSGTGTAISDYVNNLFAGEYGNLSEAELAQYEAEGY